MIGESKDIKDEPLEAIAGNYPKYVLTTDYMLQNRNGIKYVTCLNL